MLVYDKLDLIKEQEELGNIDKAYQIYNDLIRELKKEDTDDCLGEVYAYFAEFLFANQAYEKSIEMFINAYNKDYMPNVIKQTLYTAFIDSNHEFLKSCYEKNVQSLANAKEISAKCSYEQLPLDFFGTDGVYQAFCRQTDKFVGKIKIDALEKDRSYKIKDDFSDFVIYINYNFYPIRSLINFAKAKQRRVYIIVDDMQCFLSCLKIDDFESELNNIHIFTSIEAFKEFFLDNTDVYLPRNIFSTNKEKADAVNTCIDDIHQQRINMPKNEDNVLLTIGILSYNRGHRALEAIQHLLKCSYDSEVEFLLSNNDSTQNTKGYEQIKALGGKDTRISYYDVDPNYEKPGIIRNFKNVLNKAKGKYCLFVSDEDLVFLNNLHHYLAIMRDNDDLAVISASGSGGDLSARTINGRFSKGSQAQMQFFLKNVYISGFIYNTKLFAQTNAQKWFDEKNTEDNLAFKFYFYTFSDMFMLQYGDLIESNIPLIYADETMSEKTLSCDYSDKIKDMAEYAFFESRLLQHKYWCEFIKELAGDDVDFLIKLNDIVVDKTIFFLVLHKKEHIAAGFDWDFISQQACDMIMNCFDLYLKNGYIDKKHFSLKQVEDIRDNMKNLTIYKLKHGIIR